MKWHVLRAIFKRDFVSYFSSPTGYVFICVFVVLSALATFWPPEFFATNLANLDQLSRWLPFIMLVFIPAITMSIWAEERRQGTDELLLTIPASDFEVVLGKYLAAVAIFTVSLLFSALSIYTVFKYGLGDPDFGLFASTYVGYWFIGIAMISIGMVASFLTANLTVGFILGTLFNLPLALFGVADWFPIDSDWAETIRRWSAVYQFGDFERGVISLGGVTYFVMIAAVMVYLSMVLIGRRHWQSREDGPFMLGHYLLRGLALLALAAGVTVIVQNRNWLRADVSSERLSTLSGDTLALLEGLRENDKVKAIKVDAYVSPKVPTEFAPLKINLKSTLEEFRALGGGKIEVELHEIANFGDAAESAESNFGITPQEQRTVVNGVVSNKKIFMGLAVTSGIGLEKVVVPFINKGIPIEYELIRSIMTVADQNRKKIGVVNTGVPLMNPDGSQRGESQLITELRKQYDVTIVDPSQPIRGGYDALLAIQPSMMDPDSFDHFVDAVRAGTPTAVLEDPFPFFYGPNTPGAEEPKQSQQMMMMGMFGGGGQQEPKGDINQLWRLLGIKEWTENEVIWQKYTPEQAVRSFQDPQWVFIDESNQSPEPFNDELAISSGLNQLLLLYPGSLAKRADAKTSFEQVLQTGVGNSGTTTTQVLQRYDDRLPGVNRDVPRISTEREGYVLAAQIKGAPPEDESALAAATLDSKVDPADAPENADEKKSPTKEMNVIVVADIDWIMDGFFMMRAGGDDSYLPATQNVTLILNIIDSLTGDERFIDIRKRTREHRTLTRIDEATKASRDKAIADEDAFVEDITKQVTAVNKALTEKMQEIESRTDISQGEKEGLAQRVQLIEAKKVNATMRRLADERSSEMEQIEYKRDQEIESVQNWYKSLAILIPPIPPLLLALAVFFRRRELERQGVSRERLR